MLVMPQLDSNVTRIYLIRAAHDQLPLSFQSSSHLQNSLPRTRSEAISSAEEIPFLAGPSESKVVCKVTYITENTALALP